MRRADFWLSGWRPYALLAVLCLVLYLPGIAAIPPLDRDEARFAQASRQMLETGDFLRIRFQDEARNKKPAGIYWLQAASVSVFSTPESSAMWPYRLPSLVGATGAVLLTFAFGSALFRPEAALIGAMLLGSALALVSEAHIAKTDAALLAAIVAGQGALGLVYMRARSGGSSMPVLAALFWIAETAAILLKGPVAPGIAVLTALALSMADREWRWLRRLHPLAGITLMALAVAPWIVAIERATDGTFLAGSLGQDFWSKLIGAQESHGAPPITYLLLSAATFWPGSLMLVPALAYAWRRRALPAERFLLAWLVPAWIVLELLPTKLPHYVLPLYPALALLAGAALAEGARAAAPAWLRYADVVAKALWTVVTLALASALIVLPIRFGDGLSVAGIIGGAAMLVLATALFYRWPRPPVVAAAIVALSALFVVPAGLAVVPDLDRLWLSRSAAALISEHSHAAGIPVVAIGYREPSLVFLLGGHVQLAAVEAAADILSGGGSALVGSRDERSFKESLSARGLRAHVLGAVAGFDYSNGQRTELTLYNVSRAE
jgi:4-amino-4-deoxy-L-arabinose transferase-like glycosyltransferase